MIKNYGTRVERLVKEYEEEISSVLEKQYQATTTRADRIADKVAAFGGSWKFIITFGSFLAVWITFNVLQLTQVIHFDEYPFILLNLCLSFVAAFQAPIIMMSQNRQAARDNQESIIDFAINYKAEQEIDDMQEHLHRMEDQLARIEHLLSSSHKTGRK